MAVACDLGMTALTAPIIMLNHAGSILSTLMGVDGGWRPQVRDRNGFAHREWQKMRERNEALDCYVYARAAAAAAGAAQRAAATTA